MRAYFLEKGAHHPHGLRPEPLCRSRGECSEQLRVERGLDVRAIEGADFVGKRPHGDAHVQGEKLAISTGGNRGMNGER